MRLTFWKLAFWKLSFMKPMPPNDDRPDVETLAAVIAQSQIWVAAPVKALPVKALSVKVLPSGYDEVDVAILDWIVAEGRRAGRGFAPM
jgi:hypothetical protein